MGDVMQLRRPTWFVLGMGISNSCLFRRILWTARTLHEASEAISLVSNPLFSKVSIKICCAASSCGAMVVANTKAADSGGLVKEEGWAAMMTSKVCRASSALRLAAVPEGTTGQGRTATNVQKWTPLKKGN
jgi:hypothetical protein